jgi:hypothetical protein
MVVDYHPADLKKEINRLRPMVERQIVVLICACMAVIGTFALAVWLDRETPHLVDIGDLDGVQVGTLVRVEGTVDGTPVEGPYVSVVRLVDATGNATSLFMSFPFEAIPPGTRVSATGRVAVYQGKVEVVVEGPEDIVVLSRPRSPVMDLDDLVGEPWGFDGLEPKVRVTLLTTPLQDLNGEDRWCLVGKPSSGNGQGVLVLIGPHVEVGTLKVGDEVDLRVAVRYDASSGFVYLEVLDLT